MRRTDTLRRLMTAMADTFQPRWHTDVRKAAGRTAAHQPGFRDCGAWIHTRCATVVVQESKETSKAVHGGHDAFDRRVRGPEFTTRTTGTGRTSPPTISPRVHR